MAPKLPLVVIVGPTASGKSQLALKVARKFNGEIVCADSRTVYKGMDIGTAKPSQKDQKLTKHHLLDVVAPNQPFTVYDFKKLATRAITDIRSRNNMPLLVGGTGLYVDSVLFDYDFPTPSNNSLRKKLLSLNLKELHKYCKKNYITLPGNYKNKRHVISAIIRNNQLPRKKLTTPANTITIGISTSKTALKQRIVQRTEHLFSHGVVEEAKKLGEKYGWNHESMRANIYPLIYQYLKDGLSLEATKEKVIVLDQQLAKRQMTWLKRNKFIKWCSLDEAENYLFAKLAKIEQK